MDGNSLLSGLVNNLKEMKIIAIIATIMMTVRMTILIEE